MTSPTANLLALDAAGDEDRLLVERAVEGSRHALHQLVERHQPFVYNIALKMFGRREDARDLTQEVFVKVITSLKTFRHESAFRTWLYRLTVSHFLKTRRRALELSVESFETYFEAIAAVPSEEPSTEFSPTDETIVATGVGGHQNHRYHRCP